MWLFTSVCYGTRSHVRELKHIIIKARVVLLSCKAFVMIDITNGMQLSLIFVGNFGHFYGKPCLNAPEQDIPIVGGLETTVHVLK